jgi:hypothetical protein
MDIKLPAPYLLLINKSDQDQHISTRQREASAVLSEEYEELVYINASDQAEHPWSISCPGQQVLFLFNVLPG